MPIYHIKKVTVQNNLHQPLHSVRVLYGQSVKGTDPFSYVFDWRIANIETGNLMANKVDVYLPDIPVGEAASEDTNIPYTDCYRGYWQVYFEIDRQRYRINKNNAQVNPCLEDDGKYVNITISKYKDDYKRLDFVMNSGKAYFYATDY